MLFERRPTSSEVRAELERIWRERPLRFADRRAGWRLLSDIKDEGGYYLLADEYNLVSTRGRAIPNALASLRSKQTRRLDRAYGPEQSRRSNLFKR